MFTKNTKLALIGLGMTAIIGLSNMNKADDQPISTANTQTQQFSQPQTQFPNTRPTQNPQFQATEQVQNSPKNFGNQTGSNNARYQQIQAEPLNSHINPPQIDPHNHMLGGWGIQTKYGTTVAQYMPNGLVMGMYQGPRDRSPRQFKGKWSIKTMGNDRFSLTISIPGQKPSPNILRLMPDGNLYNETYQAIAYKMPANQLRNY